MNWKVGKSCELRLHCEAGVMKVTMTADLGDWVQSSPKRTESSDQGHKGPRRRAGPSHLRRKAKRADERAAVAERAAAASPPVVQTDQGTAANAPPGTSAPAALPGSQQSSRTCKKCGKPCLGHAGPTGARCSNVPTSSAKLSPEKLRSFDTSSNSLLLTPGSEDRVENCRNCGGMMSLNHQCDEESEEVKTFKRFQYPEEDDERSIYFCRSNQESEGNTGKSCFDSDLDGTSEFVCYCTSNCKFTCPFAD